MNLTQLRGQVQDHGYADISSGEVDAAINVAYLEICGSSAWPFLEAGPAGLVISPGSNYASLKAGLGSSGYAESSRVLGVAYSNKELGAISPDDFFGAPAPSFTGIEQVATPTHYTIFAGNLYVTPIDAAMGATVQVRFLRQPGDLSGSDTPIFPSRYHQLIVYGAVAVLAGEDDDDGNQSRFRALFDKGLEQMKADLMIKSEGRTTPYGNTGSLNYWADRVRSAGFPKATNSEVALLLKDTIDDVSSRFAWPFLRVDTNLITVPGSEFVSLPSDFSRSLGLYIPELGSQVFYSSLADHRFDYHPNVSVPRASAWNSMQTYSTGDVVLYSGVYYAAIATSTGVTPGTDQTKWTTTVPRETTGSPERYSLMPNGPGTTSFPNRSNRLVLWPIPNREYSLKLLYERKIIVSTTNPLTAIEWPGPGTVLELGIMYRLAMRSTEKDAAARLGIFKNEYEESITRMRNDLMIEQRDRDPVVRITQTDLWDY